MATDVDELRRLLAEIERRPRLARDPRVQDLIKAATRRLGTDPMAGPSRRSAFSPSVWIASFRHYLRGMSWRLIAHVALDVVVVAILLVVLPELYFGSVNVFSYYSLACIAAFWMLVRSEFLRVLIVESVLWVAHLIWFGFLWVAEAFSVSLRRRWLELTALECHLRQWRKTPRSARHHQGLLAFIMDAFSLEPSQLDELRPSPDIGAIPGPLSRLGNPALRWPGDVRLLPSSVRWTVLQALRLRRRLDSAPPPVQSGAPSVSSSELRQREGERLSSKEADALRSRIKLLQEEITKIQGWNVRKPEEEQSRSLLIKEKMQEINSLRSRIQSLSNN